MRKIEIEITEEQYKLLNQEIEKGTLINIEEETNSGFNINLISIEGDVSWLEFVMQSKIDLGEVNWTMI